MSKRGGTRDADFKLRRVFHGRRGPIQSAHRPFIETAAFLLIAGAALNEHF